MGLYIQIFNMGRYLQYKNKILVGEKEFKYNLLGVLFLEKKLLASGWQRNNEFRSLS